MPVNVYLSSSGSRMLLPILFNFFTLIIHIASDHIALDVYACDDSRIFRVNCEQVEEEETPKEGEEKPEVRLVTDMVIMISFTCNRVFQANCPDYEHLCGFQGEKQKKKTTKTEKYWDWELTNETKPIWVSSNRFWLCLEAI